MKGKLVTFGIVLILSTLVSGCGMPAGIDVEIPDVDVQVDVDEPEVKVQVPGVKVGIDAHKIEVQVPAVGVDVDIAGVTVDLDARQVSVRGKPVKLTRTEYRLLAYLLRNAGRVLTFQQILDNVWGWEYQESVEYVHVYIWHLRQKLERESKHPQYLLSEHGVGYRFQGHPPQADWHHSRLINAGSPR